MPHDGRSLYLEYNLSLCACFCNTRREADNIQHVLKGTNQEDVGMLLISILTTAQSAKAVKCAAANDLLWDTNPTPKPGELLLQRHVSTSTSVFLV